MMTVLAAGLFSTCCGTPREGGAGRPGGTLLMGTAEGRVCHSSGARARVVCCCQAVLCHEGARRHCTSLGVVDWQATPAHRRTVLSGMSLA